VVGARKRKGKKRGGLQRGVVCLCERCRGKKTQFELLITFSRVIRAGECAVLRYRYEEERLYRTSARTEGIGILEKGATYYVGCKEGEGMAI